MKSSSDILVGFIDDLPSYRIPLSLYMEANGPIKVIMQANNGREMIELLESAEQLPDVCIIDINMPEMNGFELLTRIKEHWPAIKSLILTVFEKERTIYKMLEIGANGYLLKTCDPQEIVEAIVTIHQFGYYYSSEADNEFFKKVRNKELSFDNFTEGEIAFLYNICSELSYQQIADKMNTTYRSVDGYRDRLFKKFGVNSRYTLSMAAIHCGVVNIEIPNSKNNKL